MDNPTSKLIGIKFNQVKNTAALFESRSTDNSPSPSQQINQLQQHQLSHSLSLDQINPTSFPPGHVNQIKNQFLSTSQQQQQQQQQRQQRDLLLNRTSSLSPSNLNRLSATTTPTQHPYTPSHSQSISSEISSTTDPSSPRHDLFNLSLISDIQLFPHEADNTEKLHLDLPSDSDSTSTSHHQPSISAFSTNGHPSSLPSSSNNQATQDPPKIIPSPPSPPQSSPSRSSQEILNDISSLALSARITEAALSIQEVALALFQVQELRHSNTSGNAESNRSASSQTSPSLMASDRAGGSSLTQVDKALMRLEKKVETTTVEIAELQALITTYRQQERTNSDEGQLLNDRFETIVEEWDHIQADANVLKDELKEDKWLVVFRAVSGQAEEMMASLEKVLMVSQEFIRETHKLTRLTHNRAHLHSSQIRNNRDSLGSSTSSIDRHESEELLKSYHALYKNFHAKNKHYVPSCQRVLGILSKGITSRSTKNGEVLRRYADMNVRFTSIQEMIDKTELDLLAVEKLLQQHVTAIPSESLNSAQCSIQVDDFSRLQPPLPNAHPARTPDSSTDSKTRKALSSMSNYIMSTSPKFFPKQQQSNGLSSSISPFRKLASKFAGSSASLSNQPSSISSNKTPPTHHLTTTASTSTSSHRPLRSIRSTLNVHNPSINRVSRLIASEERPGPSNNLLQKQQQCSRPSSRQMAYHQHTPSYEKPRWNISLKRVEDTPKSITSSASDLSKSRRTSHYLSSSHSRSNNMRASTPSMSMMTLLAMQNQQQAGGPERPGSVAGRSEGSCMTTVSMSVYRSRPPSRHSRIPAPLWDPSMVSQRVRSKGSIELQEIVRGDVAVWSGRPGRPSTAMGTMRRGLLSPTASDLGKLPVRAAERRVSRTSMERAEPLERLLEQLELDEPNPADPLDTLVHRMCRAAPARARARRIDSPLSRNAAKARLSGAGVGDVARYAFAPAAGPRSAELKPVLCKLVEAKRIHPADSSQLKVLVRDKSGWIALETYLHDALSLA